MHTQHWLEDDDLDRILKNYDDNEDGELTINWLDWLLSFAYDRHGHNPDFYVGLCADSHMYMCRCYSV